MLRIQELKREMEETQQEKDKIKQAARESLEILEKDKGGDEFLDPRPFDLGEMYERIDVKHILDYAQRLPKIVIGFNS